MSKLMKRTVDCKIVENKSQGYIEIQCQSLIAKMNIIVATSLIKGVRCPDEYETAALIEWYSQGSWCY